MKGSVSEQIHGTPIGTHTGSLWYMYGMQTTCVLMLSHSACPRNCRHEPLQPKHEYSCVAAAQAMVRSKAALLLQVIRLLGNKSYTDTQTSSDSSNKRQQKHQDLSRPGRSIFAPFCICPQPISRQCFSTRLLNAIFSCSFVHTGDVSCSFARSAFTCNAKTQVNCCSCVQDISNGMCVIAVFLTLLFVRMQCSCERGTSCQY